MRLLVTDAAAQPPRQATAWLIMTLGRKTMNISDFVSESLKQILSGVESARTEGGNLNCVASMIGMGDDDPKILRTLHGARGVFLVKFDIAVTVSDQEKIGGSANGGLLSVLSLSAEGQKDKTSSSVSRLQFEVPITYRH